MRIFMRYLGYKLKKSTLRSIIITLIGFVICQGTVEGSTSYEMVEWRESGIYIRATLLGIICTLIPILELAPFKNRRNLDTLFFFPIKRWKMAIANYLSGWIQISFIYSVCFLGHLVYLLANTDCFTLIYMLPYYALSMLIGLMMYSIFAFVFNEANTVADGVIFCILWMFLGWMAYAGFCGIVIEPHEAMLTEEFGGVLNSFGEWGIIYAPINNLTVIFRYLIETNRHPEDNYYARYALEYLSQSYMFAVWGTLGFASVIGYIFRFAKKSAYKAGEISRSPFGYMTLIPIYGYSLLAIVGGSITLINFIIVAFMLVGYIVYRRSVRIRWSDIVVLSCSIIPMLLASI